MSSSSSDISQASTKANGDPVPPQSPKSPSIARRSIKHVAQSTSAQDILLFLVAFRLLNALTVRTFFQPDEYFQSLEPAWALAFGADSGAWITWEWKNHLRSAIHPAIFAVVYRILDGLARLLNFRPNLRAELLLAGPKTLQALITALGDYYTWRLGEQIYGRGSTASWAALALTIASPWQWFCSTRTLSNCLETTLTIVALYNWPWHWMLSSDDGQKQEVDHLGLRVRDTDGLNLESADESTRLRRSLLLAALATILRPTNILIWASLTLLTFVKSHKSHGLVRIPWTEQSALVHYSAWTLVPSMQECLTVAREGLLCSSIVLFLSLFVDRLFYGAWTFPPFNFLYFNVVQSLAVFYGNNDWHYYLSQGYPLLLTTALPFALIGTYQASFTENNVSLSTINKYTLQNLAMVSLIVPAALSILAHKEVRFIYPLLPSLHVLSALPLAEFFGPALLHEATHPKLAAPYRLIKRVLLLGLILINATIAIYTTTVHNSGIITVTHYLRNEFTNHYLPNKSATPTPYHPTNMTVAFLMPCHSTPWRSHLQHPPTLSTPGIEAWALTCEPPLHLSPAEKATYQDEADIFYANPSLWLKRNMMRGPPVSSRAKSKSQFRMIHQPSQTYASSRKRDWPDYVVFFEQLEGVLQTSLAGSGYVECEGGRIWNSAWHDDWRRKGDVLVWCLDKERQARLPSPTKRPATESATRPLGWLKGIPGMKRAPTPMADPDASQKILGGGMGPWGIGGRARDDTPAPAPAPVTRVVEKPFWKQRPPEPKPKPKVEMGRWWERIPGLRPRKKSWWERIRDAGGL